MMQSKISPNASDWSLWPTFWSGKHKWEDDSIAFRCFHTSWCSLLFLHYFHYFSDRFGQMKWGKTSRSRFKNSTNLTWLGGGFKYFYFHPYVGQIPIFTNIFQMGWNHQLPGKDQGFCHIFTFGPLTRDWLTRVPEFPNLKIWRYSGGVGYLVHNNNRFMLNLYESVTGDFSKRYKSNIQYPGLLVVWKRSRKYPYLPSVFQKINNQILNILKCAFGGSRTFVSMEEVLCRWFSGFQLPPGISFLGGIRSFSWGLRHLMPISAESWVEHGASKKPTKTCFFQEKTVAFWKAKWHALFLRQPSCLPGGNSNIFWNFHPDPWGNDPFWLICWYFANGLKPPTSCWVLGVSSCLKKIGSTFPRFSVEIRRICWGFFLEIWEMNLGGFHVDFLERVMRLTPYETLTLCMWVYELII